MVLEDQPIIGCVLTWQIEHKKVILKSGTSEYHSDLRPLRVGVPQGSTLGPLLFINGIKKALNFGHISLFADDTAAVIVDEDFKSKSQ